MLWANKHFNKYRNIWVHTLCNFIVNGKRLSKDKRWRIEDCMRTNRMCYGTTQIVCLIELNSKQTRHTSAFLWAQWEREQPNSEWHIFSCHRCEWVHPSLKVVLVFSKCKFWSRLVQSQVGWLCVCVCAICSRLGSLPFCDSNHLVWVFSKECFFLWLSWLCSSLILSITNEMHHNNVPSLSPTNPTEHIINCVHVSLTVFSFSYCLSNCLMNRENNAKGETMKLCASCV